MATCEKVKEKERARCSSECEIDVSYWSLSSTEAQSTRAFCRNMLIFLYSRDVYRTRSSFASPMHERETMQPQSANAFTNFGNPSMDDYEKPNGVYRTETNYTNGSMEKGRFNNAYADAQSVHSIPPAYSHNNGQQQRGDRGAAGDAANMSGATLLNASTNSQSSAAEHVNGAAAHPMLAGINTTLSSFKPVPPPGSKPAAPAQQSRQDEPSYPPRMQSQNAIYQERSGTPSSARRQQQQWSQDDYAHQQQQQDSRSYSRNGPSQQQQQYNPRHVPPSPAYSNATSGSGRSRQGEAYASPQDYFTPREDSVDSNYARAMSPTSPTGAQYQQGAGHRYRQPPQNRSQYQPAPPSAVAQGYPDQQQSRQRVHSPSNAYQNPYAAFAEDDTASLASQGNAYPAGQAQYNDYRNERRQQQQYQNQGYSSQQSQYQQDSYFPEQSRYQQQQPQGRQDDHSAPYNTIVNTEHAEGV